MLEQSNLLPTIECQAARRAYRLLRTRVLQRLEANKCNTVGVTGTAAGEGKTLAAINLAYALAEEANLAVTLADLDLQRPRIAEYLGMPRTAGLTDYLSGEASAEQIVHEVGTPRLEVIPSFAPTPHSSEFLRSPAMAGWVAGLRKRQPWRVVIFDLPPLLMSDDVLAFAPQVDGFLLVVSQGLTARRSLVNLREMLAELSLLGVVLNRSTESHASRYY